MTEGIISLSFMLVTLLVGVFFAYIYSLKSQSYLLFWTAAWALFGLQYLGPGLHLSPATDPWLSAVNHVLFGLAGICFFLGTQLYTHRTLWLAPAIGTAVLLVAWSAANALHLLLFSSFVPASGILIAVGILFWWESQQHETLADRLLSIGFILWGATFFWLHLLRITPENLGSSVRPISAIPTALVSMLLVMAIYEEEKRRVERNMLALSNLNLATSSFVGGEIQKMLAQALDRVLSVVRIPSGALFLHYGDPQGPTSVVATGMNNEFCAAVQEESLDDYLVGLVARLGGLVVLRELSRDSSWGALEREPSFRRLRELVIAQHLRTL